MAASKNAFGPYVQPVSFDPGNAAVAAKALRGARCLLLLGPPGKLLAVAKQAKVQHLVLVSAAGACFWAP